MSDTTTFSTQTDQRWYALSTAVICLALGAAAEVGMWLWLRIPGPAILVSGVFIFMAMIMGFTLSRQKNIPLHFYGNALQIFHLDGQVYTFETLPGQVFRFYQNPLERRFNVGRVKIKGTPFYFYGVQNFSGTRAYIQEHFPEN